VQREVPPHIRKELLFSQRQSHQPKGYLCHRRRCFSPEKSVFVASARIYWCLRSIKDIKVLRVLRRNAASCAKAVKARSGDAGPETMDEG